MLILYIILIIFIYSPVGGDKEVDQRVQKDRVDGLNGLNKQSEITVAETDGKQSTQETKKIVQKQPDQTESKTEVIDEKVDKKNSINAPSGGDPRTG
jgi:hypothetical protein